MRFRTRAIGTSAIALLGVVTFAGCAAAAPAPSQSSGIETVARTPGGTAPVESVTWNLGSGEPATLDPPNVPTYSAMAVVSNLCDSLLTVDETGGVTPGLTEVEAETPTRLVFSLRAQAAFWDGSPVTTDDIVYSMERTAAPTSYLSPTFQNVTNIEALSDTEVVVEFSEPDAAFLPTMAGVGGAIMQRAFGDAAGEALGTPGTGLMCSGPFVLDEWNVGTDLRLVKNDAYWNEERKAQASEIRLTFVTDTSALTQALSTGEIDGGWEIPASSIPPLQGIEAGELFYGDTTTVWSLRVANPESPLASDAKLRQAFQQMIDRDAIADAVFHGAAQPWSTAISPNSWPESVRDSTIDDYEAIASERTYDPERAGKLVEEAGAEGAEVELIIASGDETASQLAQLVQAQAEVAGLKISIRALQPLEYAQAMYDPAVRGDSDLMLSSSGDIVQEPLASIRYYYLPDGLYNWDGFSDDTVNDLFSAAVTEPDEAARTDLTLQIQQRFEDVGSTIAIVNPYQVNFVNKRLGGVITSFAYVNMPSLASVGSR